MQPSIDHRCARSDPIRQCISIRDPDGDGHMGELIHAMLLSPADLRQILPEDQSEGMN